MKHTPDSSENEKLKFDGLMTRKLNRRSFLHITEGAAGILTGFGLLGPLIGRGNSKKASVVKIDRNPFKLGVASGDPLPDGVVLWTRLAPEPLINGGGMPPKPVKVKWEVAKDDSFKNILTQGTAVADPFYAHSVHVEVDGLEPDNWYYYRFTAGPEVSKTGRTKTAPAAGAAVDRLNFAFVSCQSYTAGYYTAYEHLVEEDLDVIFFLGDYIYEGKGNNRLADRAHLPPRGIQTLEEYRIRYGQYKSDPALQMAHAAFPWIVTLDDHEVKNNWGGDDPPYGSQAFMARRAAAFQAYYEHMPLRKSSIPDNINMQLYRKFSYGDLVEFSVLDTRQYRSGPACVKTEAPCPERFDAARSILGDSQEKWLFNSLKSSTARWNVLAQQVIMARKDREAGPELTVSMDKWDGYVASRDRLFTTIKENNIANIVVLTGDSHQNWVNDLMEDFNDPASGVLATEFGCTSISSGGNGTDLHRGASVALDENPHIKFANAQRGYVRCSLTPDQWRTDFRVVPFIDAPSAPVTTRASFVVHNGQPGAVKV